jgi:hypothetical protein
MRQPVASRRFVPAMIALGCAFCALGLARLAAAGCDLRWDCQVPDHCGYTGPVDVSFGAPASAGFRNLILIGATPCNAIPGHTGPAEENFDINYFVDITTDFVGWSTISGIAHGRVRREAVVSDFEQRDMDTELVQFDISDGPLPAGMMIRESPTLASPGHTRWSTFQWMPGFNTVHSFFDIFTELSQDGGQTWAPADRSARLTLESVSPTPTVAHSWGVLKLLYRN